MALTLIPALAQSDLTEDEFVKYIDKNSVKFVPALVNQGASLEVATLIAKYSFLKEINVILNRFHSLGCNTLLDHKRRKRLHYRGVRDLEPFSTKYLNEYRTLLDSVGINHASTDAGLESGQAHLVCE